MYKESGKMVVYAGTTVFLDLCSAMLGKCLYLKHDLLTSNKIKR